MSKVLPNFLVIGVEKGGTTWLYAQLKKHPDIFLSDTKEIHYFNEKNSNLLKKENYQQGLSWYKDFFRTWKQEKAIGDITPMYICDRMAPKRIKEDLPEVKLVVILRNPIDRAYSHYWMAKNKNHIDKSFDEVIKEKTPKIIERGLYAEQLKGYFDLFPRENIKILFFEELFIKTEFILTDLCSYLEVDSSFFVNNDSINEKVFGASSYKNTSLLNLQNKIVTNLRKSKITGRLVDFVKRTGLAGKIKEANRVEQKYEKIKPYQREELIRFYKEDVVELERLIGREIKYWDI